MLGQRVVSSIMLGLLTISTVSCSAKCDAPTIYKTYHYFTVYLAKPEKTPENFYLVLTKNKHNRYGGQCHDRLHCEPIIRFEQYNKSKAPSNQSLAFVQYSDLMDAINSDQPAHNVRVRSGDHYITLSKLFVREFRNGLASGALARIIHARHA